MFYTQSTFKCESKILVAKELKTKQKQQHHRQKFSSKMPFFSLHFKEIMSVMRRTKEEIEKST